MENWNTHFTHFKCKGDDLIMNKQQIRKGAAYIRYSNSQQDNNSVEIQLQAIKEYAKENNIDIVKIYEDGTGANATERNQFESMIKDSNLDSFDVVLVQKIDRFARNTMDFLNYEKELNDNGVNLIAVEQPFGNSPAEKVSRKIMIAMIQMFDEIDAKKGKM